MPLSPTSKKALRKKKVATENLVIVPPPILWMNILQARAIRLALVQRMVPIMANKLATTAGTAFRKIQLLFKPKGEEAGGATEVVEVVEVEVVVAVETMGVATRVVDEEEEVVVVAAAAVTDVVEEPMAGTGIDRFGSDCWECKQQASTIYGWWYFLVGESTLFSAVRH